MPLTREQIRNRQRHILTVHVPVWQGDVLLRRLTARQRMQLNADFAAEKLEGERALQYLARLIVETAIDEAQRPLFTRDEVEALIEDDWDALETLANAAMQHNKLNQQIVEDAKKNSSETPSSDS